MDVTDIDFNLSIRNHMPYKVWDEISYPFLNFSHATDGRYISGFLHRLAQWYHPWTCLRHVYFWITFWATYCHLNWTEVIYNPGFYTSILIQNSFRVYITSQINIRGSPLNNWGYHRFQKVLWAINANLVKTNVTLLWTTMMISDHKFVQSMTAE